MLSSRIYTLVFLLLLLLESILCISGLLGYNSFVSKWHIILYGGFNEINLMFLMLVKHFGTDPVEQSRHADASYYNNKHLGNL
jgi:hypothetical protein